jgi:nucleoside-diphosphate-sugar epimerase
MKNVIITGSNGMIGKLVLENCLNRSDVNRVTTIARRPSGLQHPKLDEVMHNDFLDYSKIETHFQNQDVCFYCIGVYTGQVPTDEFKRITVDFTKAFADVLKRNSQSVSFCFLSGQGADSTEKSRVLFAREKGIAENYLLSLHFNKTHLFRPGYIHAVPPRKEPNFTYQIMRALYKPISFIYPNIGVTSVKLAEKMVKIGLEGSDRTVFENANIRE